MFKKFLIIAYSHVINNTIYYILVFTALLVGIITGIVSGVEFEDTKFFHDFFSGLSSFSANGLLFDGIVQAMVISVVIFVFGMSPIGALIITLCVLYKGFAFGFSAAAMYSVYKFKSLLFVFLGLIPPSLIWIPFLTFASVCGIKTSVILYKILNKQARVDLKPRITALFFSVIITFMAMFLSKIIEIYIVPQTLNIVGGLYM